MGLVVEKGHAPILKIGNFREKARLKSEYVFSSSRIRILFESKVIIPKNCITTNFNNQI